MRGIRLFPEFAVTVFFSADGLSIRRQQLMIKKLILLLFLFLIAGCAQTLSTRNLYNTESIPSTSFQAYFFAAGSSNRARAVFLKKPDTVVMVESDSPEIANTTASYAEAMSFMRATKGDRTIFTQVVSYKDTPIGYLLSYDQGGYNSEPINISLTERNGIVYFNAHEIPVVDGP
jgi:uncharacterized lipoprotein YajG